MKNKIAIFGSTSHIASDFINILKKNKYDIDLYSRKISNNSYLYDQFPVKNYDYIFNFIGSSDPYKIKNETKNLFDIWKFYDDLVLRYLYKNTKCKYFFLSSGAVYGSFKTPPNNDIIKVNINNINSVNNYATGKLMLELFHKSHSNLSIINFRLFNYISEQIDFSQNFFINQIAKSIKNNEKLLCSDKLFYRDYCSINNLYNAFKALKDIDYLNNSFDIYSKSPVSNLDLLNFMQNKFGLKYELINDGKFIIATGEKLNYYSLNKVLEKYSFDPEFTSMENIDLVFRKIFN